MSLGLTDVQIAAVRAIAAEMIGEALRGADQRISCNLDAIAARVSNAEVAVAALNHTAAVTTDALGRVVVPGQITVGVHAGTDAA